MYRVIYVKEKENGEWTIMWNDIVGSEAECRRGFDQLTRIDQGMGYFLLDHDDNVVAKKVHSRKQYKVCFEAGESIMADVPVPVDYMMVDQFITDSDDLEWRDARLYCEVELFEDDFDDDDYEKPEAEARHWKELKDQLIAKAKKYGIYEDQMVF